MTHVLEVDLHDRRTEQDIVTWFGEPIGQPHTDAGVHMKVPFTHRVYAFD